MNKIQKVSYKQENDQKVWGYDPCSIDFPYMLLIFLLVLIFMVYVGFFCLEGDGRRYGGTKYERVVGEEYVTGIVLVVEGSGASIDG